MLCYSMPSPSISHRCPLSLPPGEVKSTFTRGVELLAKQTLFAEGARGSCSQVVMDKFQLRDGKDEQTYGLGACCCCAATAVLLCYCVLPLL